MAGKPQIAFFEFTSCEGCQLTVVDTLQTHPELLDVVDIVEFREAMSDKADHYDIAFVEGSITRPSDEEKLKEIREKAGLVVALGACAHLGGVNTIRNRMNLQDVREYVYGEKAELFETYPARPIEQVVDIDAYIPGCPIDRDEFVMVVGNLLQGRIPYIPDYAVCIDCKLRENVCMYQRGQACLGPVIRAGCGAICPAYGYACEGCRGFVPNANIVSIREVLKEHGMTEHEVDARLTVFLTYQKQALEEEK